MGRKLRALTVAMIVACIGITVLVLWSKHSPAPLSTVATNSDAHSVFAAGIVEPLSEERDVSAPTTGRITRSMIEGTSVKVGDIVAEIESDDRQAELAAAKARLAIRESELARLQAGARLEERKEAAAALREAEASVALTKSLFDRRQSGARRDTDAGEALDRARADYQVALARRDLMAERLSLVTAPARQEDLAIAQSTLAAAQAEVGEAQARLEMTRLRAPIDGVLLKRYKRPGETVSNVPPTLIAQIGDIGHLRVRAQVDETDVASVAVGQPVSVTADAFKGHPLEGRVVKVGKRLGRKTVSTEMPGDRVDTRVLEVLIDLDGEPFIPVGLRVDVSFDAVPAAPAAAGEPDPETKTGHSPASIYDALPPVLPSTTGAVSASTEAGTAIGVVGDVVAELRSPSESRRQLPEIPERIATPSPATSESMATGPSPVNESPDHYTLQFASYANEASARKLASNLITHGVPAGVVHSHDAEGRMWFTVRSGDFADVAAADAAARRLGEGGLRPMVIHGRGPIG